MKSLLHLVFVTTLAALSGCVTSRSDTFTLTADLPPDFYYTAVVHYDPLPGETCTVAMKDNLSPEFNRDWRKDYKPEAVIEVYRTRKGCRLGVSNIDIKIFATYGNILYDFSYDKGGIITIATPDNKFYEPLNSQGLTNFNGKCKWLFRTFGKKRYITKLLDCKDIDSNGQVTKYRPIAAYILDELPGKTIRMKITLDPDDQPAIGDTWVKFPNGYKRCMGKNFEDQYAFCRGNHTDFSEFLMPDGRVCTIYPGCTE